MATRSPNRSPAQWAELIRQFDNSNERDTEFCQRLGLKPVTFRKHRYAANGARKRAAGAFLPVQVTTPAMTPGTIQLHLRGEVRIELAAATDVSTVVQLVKALQREG